MFSFNIFYTNICYIFKLQLHKSPPRRSAAALRVVGLLVLVGIALHLAWYVLPAYGAEAGLAALFAVPGLALLASASRPVGRRVARIRAAGRPRHV